MIASTKVSKHGDDAHPPADVEEENAEIDARPAGDDQAHQKPPHRRFDVGQRIALVLRWTAENGRQFARTSGRWSSIAARRRSGPEATIMATAGQSVQPAEMLAKGSFIGIEYE